MLIYPRTHGSPGRRKRVFFYECPRAKVGLCANDLAAPMTMADEAALAMLTEDVLAPEVVELALRKLMAKLDAPEEDAAVSRKRVTESLRATEKELARLETAVAAGGPPDTILAGIRERERRRKELLAELSGLEAGPMVRAAATRIRDEALRLLDDWRSLLLRKQVATTRQLFRKLLGRERFTFRVKGAGAARFYELCVLPSLENFFGSIGTLKKAVASPTGSAREWRSRFTGCSARPERCGVKSAHERRGPHGILCRGLRCAPGLFCSS